MCEQDDADWLPFVPFRESRTSAVGIDKRKRTCKEVVLTWG